MNAPRFLTYQWDGDNMVPIGPHRRAADQRYVVGERYPLQDYEDRSMSSHNHQFAWLHDAWLSLPESLKDTYPTEDHLRKRALIDGGFFHEEMIDVGTNAGALRVAAYARSKDEFALVIVRGGYVFVRTAKSQRRGAMDRKEFQASKDAILSRVAELLGVTTHELEKAEAA